MLSLELGNVGEVKLGVWNDPEFIGTMYLSLKLLIGLTIMAPYLFTILI